MSDRPQRRSLEDFELLNTASQLRLAAKHVFEFYDQAVPLDECEQVTQESYDLLARTAKIKHHLVPLAERWSLDRMRRLGILANRLSHSALEVLFVDEDDAIAAPIAAALLTGYARGRLHVNSAGLHPAGSVDQRVVQIMADAGIDISRAFPKPLTDDAVQAADVVVWLGDPPAPAELTTTGADDLPVAGRQVQTWELPGFTDASAEEIQVHRDTLDRRVLLLLADLLSAPAPT